jgi:hypothetical protein
MNEQTLLILVLLHFSLDFLLEYMIRDSIFAIW